MPGSKLPPGLKALKTERPDVVAKMLDKSVDEVKKMKKGGKVKRMSCPVDGMAKRGKTKIRRKGR